MVEIDVESASATTMPMGTVELQHNIEIALEPARGLPTNDSYVDW